MAVDRFTARDNILTQRSGVPLPRIQSTIICELTGLSLLKNGQLAVPRGITRAHDTDETFVRHGLIFTGELSRQTAGILIGALRARPRLLSRGFEVAEPMTDTPIYAAAQRRLEAVLVSPHSIDYVQRKWIAQLTWGIAAAERC